MDAVTGIHGKRLKPYVNRAQTLIIPLQPSLMDMRTTAWSVSPAATVSRGTQSYIRAAQQGVGNFELTPYGMKHGIEQWQPLPG